MASSVKVQKVAIGNAKLVVVLDAHGSGSAVNVTWAELNGAAADFLTGSSAGYANQENVMHINGGPVLTDMKVSQIQSTLDKAVKIEFGNGDPAITLGSGSFQMKDTAIKSTGTVDATKALVITPAANATNGTIVIGLTAHGNRG